jgi:hypothetical protein
MWVVTKGSGVKNIKFRFRLPPAENPFQIKSAITSWGYEDGPWKGPGPPLLAAADLIHKPPASIRFAPIKHARAVTVEPFKFSPAEPAAYELS